MEGFGIFIYIALGVTVLLVVASIFLKKSIPEKKDKYLSIGFYGLVIISIGIVIISLFVGGWSGMGYGFIGASILVGTIVGGLINSITK
ncbi:YesK family protein [uncultured Rummeliibacillus sp.]|uniref:YesK family protein n=1 Tax=uncultured Rummeliibacillus sp. TaxID=762292 RepID=UPI00261B5C24|nr:YesK family protein [uncultured Rummeliibacillus sp.]